MVNWQKLLDELENYETMLKYHQYFELSYVDIDEIYIKTVHYAQTCGNSLCKKKQNRLK